MSSPPFERQAPGRDLAPRFTETHLGEVVSVDDPDGLARVQVRLYSFDGPEDQDGPVWARVAMAVAGADRGAFMLPDVGDEVLITFVGGDSRFPVVIGSLWNGRDGPTETLGSRGVDRWSFQGKDGTRVSVVEEQVGQATVMVEVPGGVTAELTQTGGGKIELSAGGSTLTIDSSGVSIQTGGTFTVQSSTASMDASMVNVNTPMASFSTVVTATTVQATTVVGTTYTPGAGNIW